MPQAAAQGNKVQKRASTSSGGSKKTMTQSKTAAERRKTAPPRQSSTASSEGLSFSSALTPPPMGKIGMKRVDSPPPEPPEKEIERQKVFIMKELNRIHREEQEALELERKRFQQEREQKEQAAREVALKEAAAKEAALKQAAAKEVAAREAAAQEAVNGEDTVNGQIESQAPSTPNRKKINGSAKADPTEDEELFFDSSEQPNPLTPRPSAAVPTSPSVIRPQPIKPQAEPNPSAAVKTMRQVNLADPKAKYGSFPQRDVCGYGHSPPHPKWPQEAKLALNIVLHFQEGAETSCPLHSPDSDNNKPLVQRDLHQESQFDYGSRAGFWRLHRLLTTKEIPCTVFAAGMALERNLQVCKAMKDASLWEIASHGYTWQNTPTTSMTMTLKEEQEKQQNLVKEETEQILRSVSIHEELLGRRPVGYFRGQHLSLMTRSSLCRAGGFLYDSDSYADDLPYWEFVEQETRPASLNSPLSRPTSQPHLVIPYTTTETDLVMVTPGSGITTGEQFFEYLKQQFDALLEEGKEGRPKLMSVGLHCRISGHAGRCVNGIGQFLDYVKMCKEPIWITTREEIAKHWYDTHYPIGRGSGYSLPE